MAKPQTSVIKRQREQAKREKKQRKEERRAQRKIEGNASAAPSPNATVGFGDGG